VYFNVPIMMNVHFEVYWWWSWHLPV